MQIPEGWTLRSYKTVTSTMEEACSHLQDKTIIWAQAQTKGRGRHQRFWVSEIGNFFCSLIIRPSKPQHQWPELAFVSALAVGETIALFLANPSILSYKWPNDILLNRKKVSGILLETQGEFMVIGIGMNLVSYPQDVSYPATALKDICGLTLAPQDILRTLTVCFDEKLALWREKDFRTLREKWRERAYGLGQEIVFKPSFDQEVRGTFQDIDEYGNIKIQLPKGESRIYTAGEIFFA